VKNLRFFLRILLIAGSALLTVGVFLFTQDMINRLTQQVATTSRVLAHFCAEASFPATRDSEIERIVFEVTEGINFPMVITDTLGTPRAWKMVEVPTHLVPPESIDSLAAGLPIAPVIRERIEQVRERVQELDRKTPPIEMRHGSGILLGAVHYGEPPALRDLRWVPLASVAGVGFLLVLGLAGLAALRAAEKRTIWVGMAKETAHQLGTPLSSMLGWIELLRGQIADAGPSSAVPAPAMAEIANEMERDVERLNKVAQRFSQVGSMPSLTPQDVRPIVRSVVEYMRRRLPRGTREITIEERYDDVPPLMVNAELLEWALENLIANALSALQHHAGRIDVVVSRVERDVEITVADTGRGMTPAEQGRAFEPGYTTRRRGWGLGLPLTRRVVEEYHRGRVFIRKSTPGQGTTVVVRLRGRR
jgi:signal transduction histidine kinase